MTNSAPTSQDVEWIVQEASQVEWNNGNFPVYPSDFTLDDVEDNGAGIYEPAAIRIVSLPDPQYGTLFLNGTAVQSGAQIPASAFENGELYVQMVDRAADYSITFQFQVVDSGGATSATQTYTVDVDAINDAPVAPAVTLASIGEDSGPRLIIQAELLANATDGDSTGLTAINLKIKTGSGTLVGNGDGTWTYTPAPNDSTAVTFSYQVSDGNSATNNTATLDITPVNDAPQSTVPAVQAINEDAILTFNTLAVSDVDGDPLTVTLTAQNGALTLSRTTGLTFGAGDGTADAIMTFTGSVASINAALNGMKFVPTVNFSGNASIQIQTSDGILSDTDTIAFTVNAVADAPVITVASSAITPMPEGAAFQVNTISTGADNLPSTAALANGDFVEVWQSFNLGADQWNGIYGQRFDASGNKVGSEFQLNTYTTDQQQNVQVAALHNGGFVATWESYTQDGSAFGIYARIYDAAGNPTSTQEFLVNTSITANQQQAAIAVLTDGSFIVTWSSAHAFATSGYDIYAQHYSAAGTAIGGETLLNTVTAGSQTEPSITALTNGGYVVTWTDGTAGLTATTTKAQIFAADGTHIGSEFAVDASTGGAQTHPEVAALAGGGFVVTWQSFGRDGSGGGISAQMFDATGQKVGTVFQVNTQTTGNQEWPEVLGLADGGFLIAWSGGANGAPQGVFVQRYDSHGVAIGGEIQLSTGGSIPQLTQLQSGAVVATWYGGNSYARILDVTQATGIEDQPVTLPMTISLADTNGTPNEVLSQLRIHGLPADFTLAVGEREGGSPSGDWIIDRSSAAEIALLDGLAAHTAQLIVTPAANYNGIFNLDVTATSQEPSNGSTASVTTLVPVMITAVNDAPVNSVPAAQSIASGASLVFGAATANAITIADVDAGAENVTVTLSVAHGTLTLGSTAISGAITGNGTGTVVITASLSSINTALDGLSFRANAGYHGTDHLSVQTDDLGHSGAGGHLTAQDTVDITVTNQAPIATMPGAPYQAVEQVAIDLKATGLSVSDDGSGIETLTLSVDFGKLSADAGDSGVTVGSGNGTASLTVSGTIAALNAFLGTGGTSTLTYLADSDTPPASATLTLTVNDNDPTGALSGSAAATIDIMPVDDPAVAHDDSVGTSEETPVTFDPRQNDTDPDSPITITAINNQHIGIGHAVPVDHGSVTLNADGSLTFTPAANFNGATSFSYRDSGLHYQFFDGMFFTVTAIPTDGGVQGLVGDFDVAALATELTGSTDSFAVRYTGTITIAAGGTYSFVTSSDDGSALYIDGTLVVDNDGSHGMVPVLSQVGLAAGAHTLEIRYFQGGGGFGLLVSVAGPDTGGVDTPLLDSRLIPSRATVDVSVSPVNDAPVLAGLDARPQEVEQFPVRLQATVSDLELDAFNGGSGLYTGASLTLARAGGAHGEDAFGFDTSGALFTVDGAQLKSGGAVFATFSTSGGVLTIAFTSAETAATSALVNDVLTHIAYTNASDAPPASVDLAYSFDDGNSGAQGSGGPATAVGTATVDIFPVDDPAAARDDSVSTPEDTALTFDPRTNDTDPDGPIAIAAINGTYIDIGHAVAVDHGSVSLNADGTLTFTPAANFSGATSFTYQDGGLHYQFFQGAFYPTVANIPTTGGTPGYATDFDVTTLAQSLIGTPDNFGIRYTGTINIAAGGTYTFYTRSDDGSALYIDGALVVNNDGSHAPVVDQPGSVTLAAGRHAIEIRYFEGGGGQELHVSVAGPDTAGIEIGLFDSGMIAASTATVDVSVSAVDDAPVLANLGVGLTTIEQVPVKLDVTVSDLELDALNGGSGLYAGASLTLARAGGANAEDAFAFDTTGASFTVDGTTLKSGGAAFATFSADNGTLTITFSSAGTAATTALVNNVLTHVTYTNMSDAPPASVDLAYSFDDGNSGAQGSGGPATAHGTATVTIGAIDDPAALTDDNAATFEGAPITIDVLANDHDPDSALGVSAINGTHATVGTPIAVADGTATLNADGTLTFAPNAGFHGDTSFTYQVWPGLHYQFFQGSFNTVNAIPAGGGFSQGFTTDFDVAALAQSLIHSTDNFGIRYTGMIHVAAGGDYTFYTSSDDGSVLYIDGARVVNNDFSQGMTERSGLVTLAPGEHTLEIRYFEGGGGLGLDVNVSGPDTANNKTDLFASPLLAPASATVHVTVAPVNATPEFANTHDSVDAVEQTPVLLNGALLVTDADLDPLNGGAGLYTGASLTLARQGGASADDSYSFDPSGALFAIIGSTLQAGGASFATFSATGGTLTINFTSSETAATAALVNDVLQHIVYTNLSDAPPADVLLDYTFNDGSPGNGQGGGAAATVTTTIDVEIAAVNDAPALTVAAAAAYTEGGAPVALDPALTITDADGGPGYSASVKITSGYVAGDTIIGNGNFDAATQTFTTSLAPNATLAALQAALRNLAFASTSQNPGDLRKLEWTISDGSGENATVTTQSVINVTAIDNAPSIPGPVTLAPIAENTVRLITQAELLAGVTDPDGPFSAVNLAIAAGGGTLTDNHDGSWTYTPTLNDDTAVTFSFAVSDGIAAPVPDTATLDITPVNTAPVNTVPGTLDIDANTPTAIAGISVADVDAGSGAMTTTLGVTHGTLNVASAGGAVVAGSGTATVTLSGTLAQINTTLQAANNVVYAGAHDFFGNDTLTVTTNDHGNTGAGGPLSDIDQVAIHLNTHLTGTPGNDSFTALLGNERIDGLGGNDTITFGFKLTDATVTWSGNLVIIDGPGGSHTVLTGFEKYVFTDGTVDDGDSDPLVDDLFYYSHNHDVWNAHVDADAHYHQFGWKEGRDPSAFFSTSTYLSLNPAVKAAGADPLLQFDQAGWKQGIDPSIAFDVNAYLAANPDVKAAGVDPLAHFLSVGAQEGRQPIAPATLVAPNGFDYVYYLQHNPDVANAHIDPLLHFETVGWKEGRNPNAFFDIKGYLAHYTDVAAAGINPLDQYHQFGWNEGRDPSVDFDSKHYLAAYPDVAAAHLDPLLHFLQHGMSEGRSSFADGAWG